MKDKEIVVAKPAAKKELATRNSVSEDKIFQWGRSFLFFLRQ